MDCLQLPFIREEKAVSWTRRFLTRNVYIWPTNGSLFMTNKFESNCVQKFDVSSKYEKECNRKTTSYLKQPRCHFCQYFMRRATQQTVLVINLASQQKTAKLYFNFFSGKEKIQASIWFHLSHYAVVCEVINLWIAAFEICAQIYF